MEANEKKLAELARILQIEETDALKMSDEARPIYPEVEVKNTIAQITGLYFSRLLFVSIIK